VDYDPDMAKPLSIEIPHQLTQEQAKQRLVDGLTDARSKYGKHLAGFTETWTDNHMEFAGTVMAQYVSGRIDVLPQSVRVEVDLPMLLRMLAKQFIPQVEAEGRKMLEKK
jgi:Putative polyhydroxyalkanoic acid system protein (PHA_gran_rgn)